MRACSFSRYAAARRSYMLLMEGTVDRGASALYIPSESVSTALPEASRLPSELRRQNRSTHPDRALWSSCAAQTSP